MKITWFGQSGFMFKHNGITVVLDPYLSTIVEEIKGYSRLMPPVMPLNELRADLLFCSHNHFDHFDPYTVTAVMNNCPNCIICGPASVPERAKKRGIEMLHFQAMRPHDIKRIGEFTLHAIPATHSDSQALGLLIEVNRLRIYFSGDTLYTAQLAKTIKANCDTPIDLAFLCINGQGGNMNATEAIRLATELNVKMAIPMHYGMFAENTIDPEEFIQCSQGYTFTTMILQPAVAYNIIQHNDKIDNSVGVIAIKNKRKHPAGTRLLIE